MNVLDESWHPLDVKSVISLSLQWTPAHYSCDDVPTELVGAACIYGACGGVVMNPTAGQLQANENATAVVYW